MTWEENEGNESGTVKSSSSAPKKNNKVDMKKPLASASAFKPAIEIPATKCLRMGIYGLPKSGKTHFCLTAKRPIYIIDTEKSAQILVKQLPEEVQREIYIADLVDFAEKKGNRMDVVQSLEAAFNIIGDLIDSIENSEHTGTIIIDSMSDMWEFLLTWLEEQPDLRRARESGQIMSTERQRANKRWTQLMRLLQASDWNVILTFKAKQKWVGGAPVDVYDADWQKNTFHWLDLNVEIRRIADEHHFLIPGGRFGDKYENQVNVDFFGLQQYLTKKSGVKFE